MTRRQIIQRAGLYLPASLVKTVSAGEWVDVFDAAYEQMSVEAECVSFTYTTSLVDSQRTYMVPTYALSIRVGGVITDQGEMSGPVSADLLEDQDKNYKTTEGTPNRWYVSESTVTLSTDTNWGIGLYPVPPADDTNGLTIEGWRTPAALSADTSVPPIPAHLHDAYAWGICYLLALREDVEKIPAQRLKLFDARYQEAIRRLRVGRTGFGNKLWVRGGTAPGHTPDEVQAGIFSATVTSL